jgi:hypothetical protein
MMNINTSTNEFEPVVRTEESAVPVELLPSTRTESASEKDVTNTPAVVDASTETSENTKPEEEKEPEIEVKPSKFSVGFEYIPQASSGDIRVIANMDKLNNKELPLAV